MLLFITIFFLCFIEITFSFSSVLTGGRLGGFADLDDECLFADETTPFHFCFGRYGWGSCLSPFLTCAEVCMQENDLTCPSCSFYNETQTTYMCISQLTVSSSPDVFCSTGSSPSPPATVDFPSVSELVCGSRRFMAVRPYLAVTGSAIDVALAGLATTGDQAAQEAVAAAVSSVYDGQWVPAQLKSFSEATCVGAGLSEENLGALWVANTSLTGLSALRFDPALVGENRAVQRALSTLDNDTNICHALRFISAKTSFDNVYSTKCSLIIDRLSCSSSLNEEWWGGFLLEKVISNDPEQCDVLETVSLQIGTSPLTVDYAVPSTAVSDDVWLKTPFGLKDQVFATMRTESGERLDSSIGRCHVPKITYSYCGELPNRWAEDLARSVLVGATAARDTVDPLNSEMVAMQAVHCDNLLCIGGFVNVDGIWLLGAFDGRYPLASDAGMLGSPINIDELKKYFNLDGISDPSAISPQDNLPLMISLDSTTNIMAFMHGGDYQVPASVRLIGLEPEYGPFDEPISFVVEKEHEDGGGFSAQYYNWGKDGYLLEMPSLRFGRLAVPMKSEVFVTENANGPTGLRWAKQPGQPDLLKISPNIWHDAGKAYGVAVSFLDSAGTYLGILTSYFKLLVLRRNETTAQLEDFRFANNQTDPAVQLAYANASFIEKTQTMRPGQTLISLNGRVIAEMQNTGSLKVFVDGIYFKTVWKSKTTVLSNARLQIDQGSAPHQLVLYDGSSEISRLNSDADTAGPYFLRLSNYAGFDLVDGAGNSYFLWSNGDASSWFPRTARWELHADLTSLLHGTDLVRVGEQSMNTSIECGVRIYADVFRGDGKTRLAVGLPCALTTEQQNTTGSVGRGAVAVLQGPPSNFSSWRRLGPLVSAPFRSVADCWSIQDLTESEKNEFKTSLATKGSFGASVAVSGDTLVVGDPLAPSSTGGFETGETLVYLYNATVDAFEMSAVLKLNATAVPVENSRFGESVAATRNGAVALATSRYALLDTAAALVKKSLIAPAAGDTNTTMEEDVIVTDLWNWVPGTGPAELPLTVRSNAHQVITRSWSDVDLSTAASSSLPNNTFTVEIVDSNAGIECQDIILIASLVPVCDLNACSLPNVFPSDLMTNYSMITKRRGLTLAAGSTASLRVRADDWPFGMDETIAFRRQFYGSMNDEVCGCFAGNSSAIFSNITFALDIHHIEASSGDYVKPSLLKALRTGAVGVSGTNTECDISALATQVKVSFSPPDVQCGPVDDVFAHEKVFAPFRSYEDIENNMGGRIRTDVMLEITKILSRNDSLKFVAAASDKFKFLPPLVQQSLGPLRDCEETDQSVAVTGTGSVSAVSAPLSLQKPTVFSFETAMYPHRPVEVRFNVTGPSCDGGGGGADIFISTYHDCDNRCMGQSETDPAFRFPSSLDRGDSFFLFPGEAVHLPSQRFTFHANNTRCCPLVEKNLATAVSLRVYVFVYVARAYLGSTYEEMKAALDKKRWRLEPFRLPIEFAPGGCDVSVAVADPDESEDPRMLSPFAYEYTLLSAISPMWESLAQANATALTQEPVVTSTGGSPLARVFSLSSSTESTFSGYVNYIKTLSNITNVRNPSTISVQQRKFLNLLRTVPPWNMAGHDCGPCLSADACGADNACDCKAFPFGFARAGPVDDGWDAAVVDGTTCSSYFPPIALSHGKCAAIDVEATVALLAVTTVISVTTEAMYLEVQTPFFDDDGTGEDGVCVYVVYDVVPSVVLRELAEKTPLIGILPVSQRTGWSRGDGSQIWDLETVLPRTGGNVTLDASRAVNLGRAVDVLIIVDALCGYVGVDRSSFSKGSKIPSGSNTDSYDCFDYFSYHPADPFSVKVSISAEDKSVQTATSMLGGLGATAGVGFLLWTTTYCLIFHKGSRAELRRKRRHILYDDDDDIEFDGHKSFADYIFGPIRKLFLRLGRNAWKGREPADAKSSTDTASVREGTMEVLQVDNGGDDEEDRKASTLDWVGRLIINVGSLIVLVVEKYVKIAFDLAFLISLLPLNAITLPRVIANFVNLLGALAIYIGDLMLWFRVSLNSVSVRSGCATWSMAYAGLFYIITLIVIYVLIAQDLLFYFLESLESRAVAAKSFVMKVFWKSLKFVFQTLILYGLQALMLAPGRNWLVVLGGTTCSEEDAGVKNANIGILSIITFIVALIVLELMSGSSRLYHGSEQLTRYIEGEFDDKHDGGTPQRFVACCYLWQCTSGEIVFMLMRVFFMTVGIWPGFLCAAMGVNSRARLALRFRGLDRDALGLGDRYSVSHDKMIWFIARAYSLLWLLFPFTGVLTIVGNRLNEGTPFVMPFCCGGVAGCCAQKATEDEEILDHEIDENLLEFRFTNPLFVRSLMYLNNWGVLVSMALLLIDPDNTGAAILLLASPIISLVLAILSLIYQKTVSQKQFRKKVKSYRESLNYELSSPD